jgi:hypothetical protein
VAAAFLGGAITTGLLGHKLENDLSADRHARTLQTDDDRAKRGKYLYIGSDVGYVIAGGLTGLATYYFLRDPLPDSEGRVLQPRDWAFNADVAPGRMGARLNVSF